MLKGILGGALLVAVLTSFTVECIENVRLYQKNQRLVPRMVDGTPAEQGQYPWMMALMKGSWIRGSFSLISPQTALGTAFCIVGVPVTSLHGRIGDTRASHGKIVYFSESIIHEYYNYISYENDIGLLILNESIQLTDRISTIAIPMTHQRYDGNAYVTGWGSLSFDTSERSEDLQVVTMAILCEKQCAMQSITDLQDTFICAKADSKGPTRGDWGAPLMYIRDNKTMSIGLFLQEEKFPDETGMLSFFVSTGYYGDWIKENSIGEVEFVQ